VYFNEAVTNSNYYGASFSNCCVTPAPGGIGNITNDPLFSNSLSGNYRLQMGSPCIDAGTNEPWMAVATDLDGKPRIIDGRVDMGAYEFGIPTEFQLWLQSHGLATDGSADYIDTDGDTYNNWAEWYSDTIPTDQYSFFSFYQVASEGADEFVIRWPSITDRTYTIDRSTDLLDMPPFVNIQSNIPGQSGFTEYVDTNEVDPSGAYFRIGVE